MKWWNQMPWSSFFECWVLSQFFTLLFHPQEAFCSSLSAIRGVSSAYMRLLIFLRYLDSSLCFIQPGILHDVLCIEVKQAGWRYTASMYSFPNHAPVCCSMSCSNCCFMSWIQVSLETGKVVWYSQLLKNFPQFVVIHTIKGFSGVNEAEVDFFRNSLAFPIIQQMLAIWSLVSLPFLNPAWTSGHYQFIYS